MSEPQTTWPASPFATVRWRVAEVYDDGSDPDLHPDWQPLAGAKVELVPSITGLAVYDAPDHDPITIKIGRVSGIIDADGWLVSDKTGEPLRIAATDDPHMSVTGWTWTATLVGSGASIRFSAPAGGEVDLSEYVLAPAVDATKAWIERIPELIDAAGSLVSIQSVTSDGTDIIVTLTDGSTSRFPIPEGNPPTAHDHDDRYYTETETDALLAGKADSGHDHAGVYDPAGTAAGLVDAITPSLHSHSNKAALDQVSGVNTGDQTLPTWSTLSGKPAVVAAGADAAAARAAIGAGTSSLVIGTTAGTAKAGNYEPDLSALLTTAAAPELIRDTMGTALVAGANVTITPNDAGDTITIAAAGGGGSSAPSIDWMPASGGWVQPQSESSGPQNYTDPNRFTLSPLVLPNGLPAVDRLAVNSTATQPFVLALYTPSATTGVLTLLHSLGVVTPSATGMIEAAISPAITLPRLVVIGVKRSTTSTDNAQLTPMSPTADTGPRWAGGFATPRPSASVSYRSPWLAADTAPASITVDAGMGLALRPPLVAWRIA